MRIRNTILPVLITLIMLVFFAISTRYAWAGDRGGKNWSKQAFSEEEGIVVIGFEDKYQTIYAFSLTQHKVLWTQKMPFSSKVDIKISDGTVFLVSPEYMPGSHIIKAVNLIDGKLLWQKQLKGQKVASPVFLDEENLYLATEKRILNTSVLNLYAFNKKTGSEKWKPFSPEGSWMLNSILTTDDKAFILITQQVAESSEQAALTQSVRMTKIDMRNGGVSWECSVSGTFVSGPVVDSGIVYFVTQRILDGEMTGTFQAIDNITGNVLKSHDLKEDRPLGDPVFVNDNPIFLTDKGELVCINSKRIQYDDFILWEKSLKGLLEAGPYVQDNRIFVITSILDEDNVKVNRITVLSGETSDVEWIHQVSGSLELPVFLKDEKFIVTSRTQMETLLVSGLNTQSGFKEWEIDTDSKLENPPYLSESTLFLILQDKRIEDSKDRSPIRLNAYNIENGNRLWSYQVDGSIQSRLYEDYDSVEFSTGKGEVISLNRFNGDEIYKYSIGMDNEMDSSIVGKGDYLGFAAQSGEYIILDRDGKLIKSIDIVPWFALWKLPILIGCLLLSTSISWYIYHARRGKNYFVRRIAGLTAIDEAVGRSTEMGKPVLYITGLADVDDIQTLASLSILGHIAQKTAEYDTPLVVPCCRSVVMSTAQEVVKESYLKAGRPDTFRSENIHYLTDDQFGYVAGVDGIMVRDKPAANFYMGKFFAESLILAETGHSTGAIQIAGTAEAAQLPFFVAACDYTLIGEEMFAASAYLSKDPKQIGSLKGQDMAKALILGAIIIGCIMMTAGQDWIKLLFMSR